MSPGFPINNNIHNTWYSSKVQHFNLFKYYLYSIIKVPLIIIYVQTYVTASALAINIIESFPQNNLFNMYINVLLIYTMSQFPIYTELEQAFSYVFLLNWITHSTALTLQWFVVWLQYSCFYYYKRHLGGRLLSRFHILFQSFK